MSTYPLIEALTKEKRMSVGRFCAMIGALIWHTQTGKYLLLRRIAARGGNWECVTGRLEQGESYTVALQREVREEVGVAVQIDFLIGTTHFYRGEKVIENEMIGVQFCCSLDNPETIRLSEEHDAYQWVTAAEAETLLAEGRWLKNIIRRAEVIRKSLPAELLAYYRSNGFEA